MNNTGHQPLELGKRVSIPISQIQPDPDQPRFEYDQEELRGLADDIMRFGQQSPVNVRQTDGGFIIITGHRRYFAISYLLSEATKANDQTLIKRFSTIDAINRGSNVEPYQCLLIQISENTKRVGFSDLERALGFERLINLRSPMPRDILRSFVRSMRDGKSVPPEIQASVVEACTVLGCNLPMLVTNLLPLLEYPDDIKDGVRHGWFQSRAAKSLNRVKSKASRIELIEKLRAGLTIVQLEQEVERLLSKPVVKQSSQPTLADVRVQVDAVELKKLTPEQQSALNKLVGNFHRGLAKLVEV